MNIFVAIMLGFAALGLFDKMIGGRLGLEKEFEQGMETAGGLALSTVGFYCVGVSYVQNHAESIALASQGMPFDPALVIGCLLAPDMGALPMTIKLAADLPMAVFTGAMVSGGLGMTVCYQLPVFLAFVQWNEVSGLMRGFVAGLITLPVGLFAGGFLLGIAPARLLVNMIPVLALCVALVLAFVLIPGLTTKILIVIGNIIRIASYLLFGLVMLGVFVPQCAVVDSSLVGEMLYLVIRMVVVACGGMVLSHLALKKFGGPIGRLGDFLGINQEAVMGLILSCTQSLAMLPLYSRMDRRGQILNAAFSVCGAYVVGGQMAFVASLVPGGMVNAYMICKALSGVAAVGLAAVMCRGERQMPT